MREIVLEGGRIGTIYLQSDLETLYSRWTGFVGIVVGVLFAAGLLAFILASRLQQIISEPILRLTTLARRVSAEKNYSLREVKTSQDEIGTLIDDFNDMLEQIQLRDRQLEQSREHLEDLVAKRTSELERLRSRLELILDTVGEGVYGVDANGLTTFLNDAASSMIGWTPEELLGKPLHALLHHTKPDGSPYPREDCPILAAARDGTVHHVEDESFWRKDGTSFSVEYVSAPMRDKQRGLVGAVVTFRDITERKRAEKALKKAKQAAESANLAKSLWRVAVRITSKGPSAVVSSGRRPNLIHRARGPWENGYVERFNGKLRDELLAGEIFETRWEAQALVKRWQQH